MFTPFVFTRWLAGSKPISNVVGPYSMKGHAAKGELL